MGIEDFLKRVPEEIRDEMRESIQDSQEAYPEMEKELSTLMRLVALAKQSPFAAASSDFIELQEMKIEQFRLKVEGLAALLKIVDQTTTKG